MKPQLITTTGAEVPCQVMFWYKTKLGRIIEEEHLVSGVLRWWLSSPSRSSNVRPLRTSTWFSMRAPSTIVFFRSTSKARSSTVREGGRGTDGRGGEVEEVFGSWGHFLPYNTTLSVQTYLANYTKKNKNRIYFLENNIWNYFTPLLST